MTVTLLARLHEQPLKFLQGRQPYAWFTQSHARANGCVQHPSRHDRDDTGGQFYVDDGAASALLTIETPNLAAIHGMPPVLDDDFLPDMGRMFGDCRWTQGMVIQCHTGRCQRQCADLLDDRNG